MMVRRSTQAEVLSRDPGSVRFRRTDSGVEIVAPDSVAARLDSLVHPVEVSALWRDGFLGCETVARLLGAGLLEDSEQENAGGFFFVPFVPAFLGCPQGYVGEARITVIGVSTDILSQTGAGARAGCAALRTASSSFQYELDAATGQPRGWYDASAGRRVLQHVTFVDVGDISPQFGESVVRLGMRIGDAGRTAVALGSVPLFLGGDHSITYWAARGVRRELGSLSVLHLDAHSDLAERTGYGVPTNGSFARWLVEEHPEMPFVTLGVRGYLPAEQLQLSPAHSVVSTAEVARHGASAALSRLPPDVPCYISLDIDVLDPSVAPGTNVPVPGGLSFEQVRDILTTVGASRRVAAVDLVELNPERDPYLRSASAAVHLVLSLLGSYFGTGAQ